MKNLLCPISSLRVNETLVRITALLVAVLVTVYIYTRTLPIILLLGIDFYIRAFTNLKYSPLSWVAAQISQRLALSGATIDKAPKIFAARVGFLFTAAISILFFISPTSSVIVGLALIIFALLEAVLNICVGCLVYTYIVFPFFKPTA